MQSKKAQFSHGDFIIAFIIFAFTLTLFFKYSGYVSPSQDNNEFLLKEGKLITDSLLSQGYPNDWTTGNVIIIGITNDNSVINNTKLLNLINMDYSDTKAIFKIRWEYYLYFIDKNDSIIMINGTTDGFGYPGINTSNFDLIDAENIAKTSRLAILDSEIVKMVVLTW